MNKKVMKISKLMPICLLLTAVALSIDLSAQTDSTRVLTQYLFNEFQQGTVKFKNGTTQNAKMNYNTVSEKMVFEKNGKFLDIINPENIDTIYLRNKKFVSYDNIYLEIVPGSVIPFYLQHKGDLMSPGKSVGYGGTSQTSSVSSMTSIVTESGTYNIKLPDDYTVRHSTLYRIKIDETMEMFSTERQFLKLFKNKETILRKFIKDNNIRFKEVNEIVKLLNFSYGL